MRTKSNMETLKERARQIDVVLDSLKLLELDIYSLEDDSTKLYFCVDFADIYEYLTLTSADVDPEVSDTEYAAKEYARVLFFNRLELPIILLPPYYTELQYFIGKEFSSKRQADFEKDAWEVNLRTEIKATRQQVEGVFQNVWSKLQDKNELSAEEREGLELATGRVLATVRRTIKRMRRLSRAGGFLSRFMSLVERERVSGLSAMFSDRELPEVSLGPVYLSAKQALDLHKPLKSRANKIDAEAIALIFALNKRFGHFGERFVLVSSAPAMLEAARAVNSVEGAENSVDVRTMDYWWLWFTVAGGGANVSAPEFSMVREFKLTLQEGLEVWSKRNAELSYRLSSRDNLAGWAINNEVEIYLRESKEFLDQIIQPLFDADWALSIIDDVLKSLASDKAVESLEIAIENIISIISVTQDVEELRCLLEEIMEYLDKILGRIEKEFGSVRLPTIGEFGR